jgi:hypothetical protein
VIGRAPIRLEVQVQPTEVIPPAVWQGFARAVYEAAHQWGIHVAIGMDGQRSLETAFANYWEALRIAGANDVGRAQDTTAE